jgi:hypothetical protein
VSILQFFLKSDPVDHELNEKRCGTKPTEASVTAREVQARSVSQKPGHGIKIRGKDLQKKASKRSRELAADRCLRR